MHTTTRRLLAVISALAALGSGVCLSAGTAMAAAGPSGPPVPVLAAPEGTAIPGRYIVTARVGADVGALTRAQNVTPSSTYASVLNGFAAALTAEQLDVVRRSPDVVAIEEDRLWTTTETANALQTPTPNWGLDRIDQRALPLDNNYLAPSDGTGVQVYVVDTGIDESHPEFGGRAFEAFDGYGSSPKNCHFHGSWVAGIVGAKTFGVAKNAVLRDVRVIDCNGVGSTEVVIKGLEYIRTKGVQPAVVNMSIGGGYSQAENDAVTALVDAGFFVAVAAGNDEDDACQTTPASTPKAFTVAAMGMNDHAKSFSNHGPCVDIYAPGDGISSLGLDHGFRTADGTSAASPFVTGAAALYKSMNGPASPATIENWLISNATVGALQAVPPNTPNRLLFVPPGSGPLPSDGTYGYVFANSQSNPDYTPSPTYQRNSSGGVNRVTRSAVGTYRVHLPGLASTGGVAHVAATAAFTGKACQSAGLGSSGTEQFVDVRCVTPDGQPVDANYWVLYTQQAPGLASAFGYVRATVLSKIGPVYGVGTAFNSKFGTNTLTRLSTGTYRVEFPSLGVSGGTVLVSAEGTEPRVCSAIDWFTTATSAEAVLVTCHDLAGSLADGLFTVTFSDSRSVAGTARLRAHAWVPALGPNSPPHTPNSIWALNSTGGPITVTRKSQGKYDVRITGVASSTNGFAAVNSTGSGSDRCQYSTMDLTGADVIVSVQCRTPAGALVDAEFVLQYLW